MLPQTVAAAGTRPGRGPRDARLDTLSVVGACGVVWLHVSAVAVNTRPDTASGIWWAANLADAMVRWSLPLFVMISGALLLESPSERDPLAFYRMRAGRLLVPLVFWTVFAFVFRYGLLRQPFRLEPFLSAFMNGVPFYHLWYLYMTLVLMAFTPFLRQFVAASSPRLLQWFLVAAFTLAALEVSLAALQQKGAASFLSLFLPFIPYFVAGYYYRSIAPQEAVSVWRTLALIVVCGVGVAIATGLILPVYGAKTFELTYAYLNPLVIVPAVAVYRTYMTGSLDAPPSFAPAVRFVAPLTLGVYVMHPFWIVVVGRWGVSATLVHPAIGIPVTTALVFALSLAGAWVLSRFGATRPLVQ